MKYTRRIAPSEHAVMRVLWSEGPLTANEIIARMPESGWSSRTVRTLLHRLVAKRALVTRRRGREFVYRPALAEAVHAKHEMDAFLGRFPGAPLRAFESRFRSGREACAGAASRLREALARDRARPSHTAGFERELTARLAKALGGELPRCPLNGSLNVELDGAVWCSFHGQEPPRPEQPIAVAAPARRRVTAADRRYLEERQACRSFLGALEPALARHARRSKAVPLLSPALVETLAAGATPPCPADAYRSDTAGQVWCTRHKARTCGNGRSDCYHKQLALAAAIARYEEDSASPLVLDPARPEAFDALLTAGYLRSRPVCFESGTYSNAAGALACSHHGSIQHQLLEKAGRLTLRLNPGASR